MPNIEIHGCGLDEDKSQAMGTKIADRLRGLSLKDAVVSACNDTVLDLGGHRQPYLRVVCTDDAEAQQVIEALKPLGIDIEWLKLQAFFPAT